MSEQNTIRWDQDGDGIVTLTLDDPAQRANTMNAAYQESMHEAVRRLVAERDTITGVILTSAKPTFFAGGALSLLARVRDENAASFAAGQQAEGDLGQPESRLRVVQGDAVVAGQRNLQAPAQGCTIQRGDHRLAELLQRPQVGLDLLDAGGEAGGVLVADPGEQEQVATGEEGGLGGGEDDAGDGVPLGHQTPDRLMH